jgi:uncharacterized membrane protein
MNLMAIASLVLIGVGVLMILVGVWLTLREQNKKLQSQLENKPKALGETFEGLAKLLEAMKTYPTGQRLIILGIVVVIIAGLFGGVSGLVKSC